MRITNHKDNVRSITWAAEIESKGGTEWRIVPTEWGFVTVAVWVDGKKAERDMTELRFIHGGILHTRIIKGKAYSGRYAVTLARRYAVEIAQERQEGAKEAQSA